MLWDRCCRFQVLEGDLVVVLRERCLQRMFAGPSLRHSGGGVWSLFNGDVLELLFSSCFDEKSDDGAILMRDYTSTFVVLSQAFASEEGDGF